MVDLSHFTAVRRWYALHLILCITFCVSSLLINAVQVLLYVTLRPLNRSLYRSINYYLIYGIMAQVLFIAEWWSGSEVRVFADPADRQLWGKEHSLIIMNHTYEVDWLVGWMVADSASILGASKVFMKKVIQYMPTVGWGLRCSDIIFLNRDWQKDQQVIDRKLREFYSYPNPVWMLLYAEGTRFTPSKHAASMQFARERGLPVLKRHLIPRTRGFVQCVRSVHGHFPAIYDVTVAFNTKEGGEPSLLSMLRGQKVVAEVYVRRLPLGEVPTEDEQASSSYLHALYQEKDRLLDSHCETGSFTQTNDMPKYSPVTLPRRYYSLLNMGAWLCVVGGYGAYTLYGASVAVRGLAALVFLAAYFMLQKLIGLTKIDKGSQYGATSTTSSTTATSSTTSSTTTATSTKED